MESKIELNGNKIEIRVDQQLVDYIERLSYEEASLKDIILTYMDAHKSDADDSAINNPIFKSYQDKYIAAKSEYEIAKNRITKEYIPTCIENHKYEWNLDFETNILTIEIKCDCGIEALKEYLCSLNSQKED